MKLIYPALTRTSLLLIASPSFASTTAISISIDWTDVAISAALVLSTLVATFFMARWLSQNITEKNEHIFLFSILGACTVLAFVAFVVFYIFL